MSASPASRSSEFLAALATNASAGPSSRIKNKDICNSGVHSREFAFIIVENSFLKGRDGGGVERAKASAAGNRLFAKCIADGGSGAKPPFRGRAPLSQVIY
jgi:hypothetical protein